MLEILWRPIANHIQTPANNVVFSLEAKSCTLPPRQGDALPEETHDIKLIENDSKEDDVSISANDQYSSDSSLKLCYVMSFRRTFHHTMCDNFCANLYRHFVLFIVISQNWIFSLRCLQATHLNQMNSWSRKNLRSVEKPISMSCLQSYCLNKDNEQ